LGGKEAAINLRQLRYFSKVVELGNMTHAADYLNVAQPALGLQIRQLEEDLGSVLLIRHSRGVEPTAAGLALFERAQQILNLVDETRQEMLSLRDTQLETVRLGIAPGIMNLIGYELLIEARKDMPQVFLSVAEELGYLLIEAMRRGELDIALAYEVPDEPWLNVRPVFEEELLFVSSIGDLPEGPISFVDALSFPLILPCSRDLVRAIIDDAAKRQNLKLSLAFEVNSPATIRTMVLRESASTIVPYGVVADDIQAGRLQGRRIAGRAIARRLYLIRPASGRMFRHEAALEDFMQKMIVKLTVAVGELARPMAGAAAQPVGDAAAAAL
jgi:LysR family nitrogen assimilation transcriptional regulator